MRGAVSTGGDGPDRVLVIACGALAREITALRQIGGWQHVDLTCLPADLHLTPDLIPAAVEAAVAHHRPTYGQRIFIAYADCGTGGGLAATCERLGVAMIAGPHCYAFFDGLPAFQARAETEARAFYLTDFLTRQFDAFCWRPMGFDRHPELIGIMFGQYEKLIYLAQTDDAALDAQARDAAARLGLAYERRLTGYGDLATVLAGLKRA
ncbi:DUF1638 domain-containing protein [Paracoccus sp. p4-l81]|uniref:DUF1638 domain-containing protein n=1 Tax=Paracoccus sp. p4-l81 TaxID=3342806 RepID=UPI0035B7E395